MWGVEVEYFSRAVIQGMLDRRECLMRDLAQVHALGEELADEPIGVLVEPRCQGLCGSQKKMSMCKSALSLSCKAISEPWS